MTTTPGIAMGVEYTYSICMPEGEFKVCKQVAFQRFDTIDVSHQYELQVTIRSDRILFDKWTQKYDTPSHPELWLSLIQDTTLKMRLMRIRKVYNRKTRTKNY